MNLKVSIEYRMKIAEKIRESQQCSPLLLNLPAAKIECYIFEKSKSDDEYLESIVKILYHLRKSQQPPNVNANCNLTTLSHTHPESKQINQGAVGVVQVGVITQSNIGLQSGHEKHPNVNAISNMTTLAPSQSESKQINQGAVGVVQVGVITQSNIGLQSCQVKHPNVNATSNMTALTPSQFESKQINQGAVGVGQVGVITQGNIMLRSGQEQHNQMMGSGTANNIKMPLMNQQRSIHQIVRQHMMPHRRQSLYQQIPNSRINIRAQRPQRAQSGNRNMTPQHIGQFHEVMTKNPYHGETQQMIRMNGIFMSPQNQMNRRASQMHRFMQPRALSQGPSDKMSISQRPTQCTGSPVINHISPHQRTSITPCSPFDTVGRQESVGCPSIGFDSRTPFPTCVLDTSGPHMQQPSISEELTPYDKIYIEMVNHLKRKYADTFNNIRRKLPQDYSAIDRFALEMWKILENPQRMVPIPTLGNYDRILEGTGQRFKETMNC